MTCDVSQLIGEFDATLPWFLKKLDPHVYVTAPWMVLDFETTNLEKGSALNPNNRLVCAAWATSWQNGRVDYHYGDEFSQKDLLRDIGILKANKGFLVAHNVKFELHWLARMGVDLYDVLSYDTMLGDYTLGGNRWQYQHLKLDTLNKKYGGSGKASLVDALIKGGVCPSQIREDLLRARVQKDIKDTYLVFKGQLHELQLRGQLPVAFTRNVVTPCLTWIETRGIGLNKQRVYEEYERSYLRMQELNAELDKMTGGINWRSSQQKARFLYGKKSHPEEALRGPGLGFEELRKGRKKLRNKSSKAFPDGAPKTDDKTLAKLKAKTKRQEKFLGILKEAGKVNAQLTKTLQFFKGVVDEYDGQFYGAFNQYNTQTHRLSSSGRRLFMEQFEAEKSAQFQNMPRQFKDLMQPKVPGRKMGEVDGSQLEFRVAAFVGQDSQAIADIRNDVDVHRFSASVLNGVPELEVTKLQRQDAKADTFKPLYGGQSGTEAQQAYYKAFREKYHQLYEEQKRWTYEVLRNKKLRIATGLEFHWPSTRQSMDGYIDNTPSIFNYPIQNLATAEIIPVALVYLWQRLRANGSGIEIVNTVHDSAIAEIPEGEEATWLRLSLQTFTVDVYHYLSAVYGIEFNVPLGAGITIGERWSSKDGIECEVNVEPDGEYWFKGTRAVEPSDEAEQAWQQLAA